MQLQKAGNTTETTETQLKFDKELSKTLLTALIAGSRTPFATTAGSHYVMHDSLRNRSIGLASDDVRKLSNAWQRGKLVLNKGSAPYKSMLGEKSLTWRSSLFLRRGVRTVWTAPSLLRASHFKRYWGSDKCGVFQSIDDLPACFCMGRYLWLEPIFSGCGAVTLHLQALSGVIGRNIALWQNLWVEVGRFEHRLSSARVTCALRPVRSIRHILESRCAEHCASNAFLTSFQATSRQDHPSPPPPPLRLF